MAIQGHGCPQTRPHYLQFQTFQFKIASLLVEPLDVHTGTFWVIVCRSCIHTYKFPFLSKYIYWRYTSITGIAICCVVMEGVDELS